MHACVCMYVCVLGPNKLGFDIPDLHKVHESLMNCSNQIVHKCVLIHTSLNFFLHSFIILFFSGCLLCGRILQGVRPLVLLHEYPFCIVCCLISLGRLSSSIGTASTCLMCSLLSLSVWLQYCNTCSISILMGPSKQEISKTVYCLSLHLLCAHT